MMADVGRNLILKSIHIVNLYNILTDVVGMLLLPLLTWNDAASPTADVEFTF